VQAAILHGDRETGVTIMKMDPGIDTGPVLSQQAVPIAPDDTSGTLSNKLAYAGAELLLDSLPKYLSGEITPVPQLGEPSYAPMLKKEDGELDFSRDAGILSCQVRAFNPWPGAFMDWQRQPLKIHRSHAVLAGAIEPSRSRPGTRTVFESLPAVATGDGFLVLDEVQPAGKKPMAGSAFLSGARDWLQRN
jgi:methionyl-tRNA formyltransferase